MLLSCFTQPTLLTNLKKYLKLEEFKNAPLLLCHKNALDGKHLPAGWSGSMYATEEILYEVERNKYTIKPISTQALSPNKIYNVSTTNNEQCPYKANSIEITAIPWDEDNLVYLIKDDYVTNILTDIITEDMTVFTQNKILRNSIKTGIDVLYVNDGFYNKLESLNNFPSECMLGALVTLVRPCHVKGLISEGQLPIHITSCCQDFFDG